MNVLRKHVDPDYILGSIPLANRLEAPHNKYELGFRWLGEGNLRLTEFVDPKLMFSNYAYRSSTLSVEHVSSRMTYARRIYDRLNNTRKPKSVCEVACNDGNMLNRYAANDDRYSTIVGVEPAENLHRYIDDRVYAYARLMGARIGTAIRNLHGAFDIIHAHNVVAHTPNPVDLLKGIRAVMDNHSVAVVEFQYLVDLLTNTQFYQFYHEHYYYYTVAGLANVAEKRDWRLPRRNGWRRRGEASCVRSCAKGTLTRTRCTISAVTRRTTRTKSRISRGITLAAGGHLSELHEAD